MKKYLLIFITLLIAAACQREGNFPEVSNMPVEQSRENTESIKLLAQMIFDSVAYAVPRDQLLQPFINEFGDGTVIDHAQIRRVQATKDDDPYYYLVGIGQKSGEFRMMAIELLVSEDNSLYLSPESPKYITASRDCDFCLFTFDHNIITGAECQNVNSGGTCSYAVTQSNTFMRRK